MSERCQIRGCVWPVLAHGLCRACLETAGLIRRCEWCAGEFLSGELRKPNRFCSRVCICRSLSFRSRVVPRDRALLEELYIQGGFTLAEIAERFNTTATSVHRALAMVGIPRRRRGVRTTEICCEPRCRRLAFKDRPRGGYRRCRFHARLRRSVRRNHLRRQARESRIQRSD